MTEKEAVNRLKQIYENYPDDEEARHCEEDGLLLEIVRSMGWREFLSAYHASDLSRWYA